MKEAKGWEEYLKERKKGGRKESIKAKGRKKIRKKESQSRTKTGERNKKERERM